MIGWAQIGSYLIVLTALLAPLAGIGKLNLPWYLILLIEALSLAIGLAVAKISILTSKRVLAHGKRERLLPVVIPLYVVVPLIFMGVAMVLSVVSALVTAWLFKWPPPLFV